ncbi:acyl-CoA N-acyltransferase [Metschnikowia bicuspidata]|uniref:Acyl-CoA N-acyltransferase n=1 Tax=Metschnikowia bicuspidata TaxID=27322 RepID=A0A4V1J334_9ASCO|nr:acyl-CoA N-acyltransferase [Metschnikowia bicuspidata]
MGRSTIMLDDLTPNNLATFKVINSACLPTTYSDTWYNELFNAGQLSRLAFFSELPVGAIKAKLVNLSHNIPSFEVSVATQVNSKIVPNGVYLESLAVLPSYRGYGVGSALLDWLIAKAKERFVHDIVLHVHVDNAQAIEWYKKKGFEQLPDVIKDYYKQQGLLNPDACFLTLKI